MVLYKLYSIGFTQVQSVINSGHNNCKPYEIYMQTQMHKLAPNLSTVHERMLYGIMYTEGQIPIFKDQYMISKQHTVI